MRMYLIVDQAPLFKECMNTHDCTYVSCKIASTGCDGEVLSRVHAVGVDHEVTIVFVDRRCLTPIAIVEELWHGLLLQRVNSVHVEPRAVAWDDDRMGLSHEM